MLIATHIKVGCKLEVLSLECIAAIHLLGEPSKVLRILDKVRISFATVSFGTFG